MDDDEHYTTIELRITTATLNRVDALALPDADDEAKRQVRDAFITAGVWHLLELMDDEKAGDEE